jgi:hypothetical protein
MIRPESQTRPLVRPETLAGLFIEPPRKYFLDQIRLCLEPGGPPVLVISLEEKTVWNPPAGKVHTISSRELHRLIRTPIRDHPGGVFTSWSVMKEQKHAE